MVPRGKDFFVNKFKLKVWQKPCGCKFLQVQGINKKIQISKVIYYFREAKIGFLEFDFQSSPKTSEYSTSIYAYNGQTVII